MNGSERSYENRQDEGRTAVDGRQRSGQIHGFELLDVARSHLVRRDPFGATAEQERRAIATDLGGQSGSGQAH